jgi:hypothetical protein
MQKREKQLAAAVAVLVALVGGKYVIESWHTSVSQRSNRIANLEKEIGQKEVKLARGRQAKARLAAHEKRSLPADRQLARSLYQNWLRGVVDRAKFTGVDFNTPAAPGRNNFERLVFSINCRGTLEQLTQFLHDFYSANHLHMIRRLQVQPIDASKELKLIIIVDALSLPGADRKELNSEPATRLAQKDLASYRKTIVERNLFAEYSPPAPPPVAKKDDPKPVEPKPPGFDVAKFAFLTAILQVGERPQIWVNVRTTGQILKLAEGDKFDIGNLHGTVKRIDEKAVELEADGKRLLVALGENLRDAAVLPPGEL